MDIVMGYDGTYYVYTSLGSPTCYDGGYETKPSFGPATLSECEAWCSALHLFNVRLRRRAHLVRPKFVRDLEARADGYMRKIRDLGLAVESDCIYKASAAWKENPTHYAYFGDFGSVAKLEWRAGVNPDMKGFDVANGWLRELFGMSTALWELGFNLTFDKDGKHTIFGNVAQWVTTDKE